MQNVRKYLSPIEMLFWATLYDFALCQRFAWKYSFLIVHWENVLRRHAAGSWLIREISSGFKVKVIECREWILSGSLRLLFCCCCDCCYWHKAMCPQKQVPEDPLTAPSGERFAQLHDFSFSRLSFLSSCRRLSLLCSWASSAFVLKVNRCSDSASQGPMLCTSVFCSCKTNPSVTWTDSSMLNAPKPERLRADLPTSFPSEYLLSSPFPCISLSRFFWAHSTSTNFWILPRVWLCGLVTEPI